MVKKSVVVVALLFSLALGVGAQMKLGDVKKLGDTVRVRIQLAAAAPDLSAANVFFQRVGEPDKQQARMAISFTLSQLERIGVAEFLVSGVVRDVASGTYQIARIDLTAKDSNETYWPEKDFPPTSMEVLNPSKSLPAIKSLTVEPGTK